MRETSNTLSPHGTPVRATMTLEEVAVTGYAELAEED